ncbi:hypothetical protein EDB85DRAFT_2278349 [Lactarius pseudohatsudake]|nr:hypothetical protein EDB85DRAFT_2278349 [Lactarius pseudohatsudake]
MLVQKSDHLAWLRVAHVCHRWHEIALNQPLFWSHVNFTTLTSAGAAGILARAKSAPYIWRQGFPSVSGTMLDLVNSKKNSRRVSHICRLAISAEHFHLRKTLEGLVSPAPTLEYLSLFSDGRWNSTVSSQVFIPDTLFNGTAPRLSHLQLHKCDISWKSLLLKGLKYLEIHMASRDARPSLSDWLCALDEMSQLTTLGLHSASPIAPPGALLPSGVERTVTLASLARLNISASVRDCGLALAHLLLPALTQLCDGSDVQEILPYVARHAHGPQDTQPLQSVLVSNDKMYTSVRVWTKPNIDVISHSPIDFPKVMPSARMTFSVANQDWFPGTPAEIFEAAMTVLPVDSLVTFTSQVRSSPFNTQSWLRQAPRWPLLQQLCLAAPAARGFTEMLLEGGGERERPLLPSLTNLVLVDTALSARRTLRLCDALMKRVEQGVPLETLDLRTCLATSRAIELLGEIVVDVLGPENLKTVEERARTSSSVVARGLFVEDDLDSSRADEDVDEDYDYDFDYDQFVDNAVSDDEVWDNSDSDGDGDGYDEDETDNW